MADPVLVPITPVNTWVKVATNKKVGKVHSMKGPATYIHTYRMTGEAAPGAGTITTEGVVFNGITEEIDSPAEIDVYVACLIHVGIVRVDLWV